MTRLSKTYDTRKAAENYLSCIKLLGAKGRVKVKKVNGKIIYEVVFYFADDKVKERV